MGRKCIVFLGTDGSGKTSLAKALFDQLPEPKQYVYFGLREAHFRITSRFYGRFGDTSILARLFIFPIDYYFRKRSLPNNGHIILDRLPGWAVINPNSMVRGLFSLVLPSCDMLILCYGDSQKIVERKPERTLEKCFHDQKKWVNVYNKYPAIRKIKINTTDQPIEKSLKILTNAVLEFHCDN